MPWRVASIVASQTAVLTAVLFYFGWARANATFGYFGVDLSLLDFSTSDYLLRSVNSAFRPLLLIGLVALAAIGVHQWLVTAVDSDRGRARWVAQHVPLLALGTGIGLAAIALTGLAVVDFGRRLGLWLPVSLAVGAALLAYAEFGWRHFRRGSGSPNPQGVRQLQSFILVGVALMALFWTVSLYAGQVGRENAGIVASGLASATQVVVYAKDRLALAGPGVQLAEIHLADSKYRYRYSGLRLLIRSEGRYVLLPRGWARGHASAYVLRDGNDIRLELTAG